MKLCYPIVFVFIIQSCLLISNGILWGLPKNQFESMVRSFQSPTSENGLWCYWYWMYDDISKSGITKDLKAMKRAGITTALIGNINTDKKNGRVQMLSDDWWNHMVHAVVEANRLGIDIGVFNCPGWSQSGGPWVNSEKAMRYLTYSETKIVGGTTQKIRLIQPKKEFQDVKVIAYPKGDKIFKKLESNTTKVTLNGELAPFLLDGNTSNSKKVTQKHTIELQSNEAIFAQSIQLFPSKKILKGRVIIQAKVNGSYQNICSFLYNRSRFQPNVGAEIYSPVVKTFPEVKASHFKIIVNKHGKNTPETFSEIIISEKPLLENFVEKKLAKMAQTPFPRFSSYSWNPQKEPSNGVIKTSEILDISSKMDSQGLLTWKPPAGNWIVQRYGMSPTGTKNGPAAPSGTGYEIDKTSEPLIRFHFDKFIGELLRRIPEKDKKAFKYVVADSYETGSQNWTDGFEQKFRERYGYDPIPFLPVYSGIIIDSVNKSERFLWDMRRLMADKIAYEYVGGLRKISNEHGLQLWLENYGHWGFPAEFMMYGGQSDLVSGEYWNEGSLGNVECKAASSTAHVYGKKRVFAECFTAGGKSYVRHPALLKRRGDWSLTEGINHHVLHVYIHQPDDSRVPGVNAGFSTEFNRRNTWFNQGKAYFEYLRRAQYLLQQGRYVADVCYFIGENTPLMTGPEVKDLPHGYSYDYINAEAILTRLSVKDGRLTLPDGMSYKMMVLPELTTMRPEVLHKIEKLVNQGAIILGKPPVASPSLENYPSCDEKIRDLSKRMWAKNQPSQPYGKGIIFRGITTEMALEQLGVEKDVELPDSVLFTHRKLSDADIYFLSNQGSKAIRFDFSFRVSGKKVQLWDAMTGKIRMLPESSEKGNRTMIPINMEVNQSWFVVFSKQTSGEISVSEAMNFPTKTPIFEIDGPWTLDFLEKNYGPAEIVETNTLFDWVESKNDKIKYYSGEVVYSTEFNYSQSLSKKLFIDFEKVGVIATVSLNGKNIGTTWMAPHTLEVTDIIKSGKNRLEVTVVNVWRNRLTGDKKLPNIEKHTSIKHDKITKEDEMVSSGLIGKVTILEQQ